MKNRLFRILGEDGRCFVMPIDHGYFQGPTTGLERPWETVRDLLPCVDALFVTRGVLRSSIPPATQTPIILRVSGAVSILGDLTDEALVTSIDDIVRLGVSAVGVSVFVGTEKEKVSLENLSRLVDACEPRGIPVMGVTAVGRELEKRDARYLGLCCRITAELGAKVVKTYWCEDFDRVTQGCPVPVIMAGGPKCETEREVFSFVRDGMDRGAVGVNLGRNVWQNPHPVAVAKALRAIIHEGADVEGAAAVFDSEKGKARR